MIVILITKPNDDDESRRSLRLEDIYAYIFGDSLLVLSFPWMCSFVSMVLCSVRFRFLWIGMCIDLCNSIDVPHSRRTFLLFSSSINLFEKKLFFHNHIQVSAIVL